MSKQVWVFDDAASRSQATRHAHQLGGRPASVSDLVAALQSEGVGEVVVVRQNAVGDSYIHMAGNPMANAAVNLKSGSYLVVRLNEVETEREFD